MSNILIITNNKKILELEAQYQCIKVDYMNISVREILRCVQERLASDSLVLLCNPLCGRSARPFPYISLMLSDIDSKYSSGSSEETNISMWNDIMTFEMMDEKNKKVYEEYSKDILEDFAVLDKDLVENGVRIIQSA